MFVIRFIRFFIIVKLSVFSKLGLFYHSNGNPLHLQNGEYLPKIEIKGNQNNTFILRIYCGVVSAKTLSEMSSIISSTINKKLNRFAVTAIDTDTAFNFVSFKIQDVTIDKSYTFYSPEDMKTDCATLFRVQDGDYIDLRTSGSMLVVGKTRSGKTTGIISILFQALICGRDDYNSAIVIIDPKKAELSVLPNVVSVDEDGEATAILQALKGFEVVMRERQRYLNQLSQEVGDAVHWWDCDMHPSFLFIDEYVACRSLFPKKADKGSDYCLTTFDNLLKRIVTMGASAGCFVIISIAEASVDEGGLPTMLKNAMTTKILFKPTITEARLLWDSKKLESFPERVYSAGDAWLSSTDGEHDDVTYVHFPYMEFPIYRALGKWLKEYNGESADGGLPQDGARPNDHFSFDTI